MKCFQMFQILPRKADEGDKLPAARFRCELVGRVGPTVDNNPLIFFAPI